MDVAFRSGVDGTRETELGGRVACVGEHPVDTVVVTAGIVMEEDESADTARLRYPRGVGRGAVPEVAEALVLRRVLMRVVDEEVDAVDKVAHGIGHQVVVLTAPALGSRAVIGYVGNRRAVALDAEAERRTTMADVSRVSAIDPRWIVSSRIVS